MLKAVHVRIAFAIVFSAYEFGHQFERQTWNSPISPDFSSRANFIFASS